MKQPTAAQAAYWEGKLKAYGLTMDRGRGALVTYGHMITDLDWDGKVTYKPPAGERLDNDEWPLSLC